VTEDQAVQHFAVAKLVHGTPDGVFVAREAGR
jgi:hypothetical protein